MKEIPSALAEHLAGEALTLCSCWQIEFADGAVLGFTDHDADIGFGGIVHEAASGLAAGAVERSAALSVDNTEITGALSSDRITDADIAARRYDGAKLRHYTVNWQDPEQRLLLATFRFGELTREGVAFRAELVSPVMAALDQTIGRRYERACSADLGDAACGIDLPAMAREGVVEAVSSPTQIRVGGIGDLKPRWLRGGRLTVTSGENAGRSVEIADHLLPEGGGSALISLWQSLPAACLPGDTLSLAPGCDKRFATCREKFSNHLNFRGFPHLPDRDFTFSYAAKGEVMDGGRLVD